MNGPVQKYHHPIHDVSNPSPALVSDTKKVYCIYSATFTWLHVVWVTHSAPFIGIHIVSDTKP
jgi:hypothetical protein